MGLSKSMLAAARKSFFNSNKWTPVGEPISLKDIFEEMQPGLYKQIDGDKATVTSFMFDDGNEAMRLAVPIKGGKPVELPLSANSDLEEGDEVLIASISGTLLRKAGQDDIMRYDGELAK